MGLVGVLYIVFERSILSSATSSKQTPRILDDLSRIILGIQIGLIGLAMVVTRSSVASIQSKRGLPFGNQVVGWTVLGTFAIARLSTSVLIVSHSGVVISTVPTQSPTQQPLPSPTRHHLPHLLPHIRYPHHLLRGTILFRILRNIGDLGSPRAPHLQFQQDRLALTTTRAHPRAQITIYRDPRHKVPASVALRRLGSFIFIALSISHPLRRSNILVLPIPSPIRIFLGR